MELDQALKGRRSVRKYVDKKVNHDLIVECIKASQDAPSWKNSQTARYYIVESEEMVKKVKEEAIPEFNRVKVTDASALVITTFKKNRAGFEKDGTPTNENGQGWGYYDLGLNNMQFLLKAYELGLASLIMGIRDSDKIRELLNVSDDEIIVSVIALGYPGEEPSEPKRKDLEDIVKFY